MMERTIINAGFRHSNSLFSFFVTGHARPQVCAAVSAVACGLVSFCLSHKDTVRNLVYRLNSGDSKVEFESDDEFVAGAWSMAEIALLGVEAGYPDDLKVTCSPWGQTEQLTI